jgi:hypothetical protein
MEAQEIFYIVATVALGLFAIALMALIYLLYRIQKFIRFSTDRIDFLSRNLQEHLVSFGRTWGRVTLTGFIIRTLKSLMRR